VRRLPPFAGARFPARRGRAGADHARHPGDGHPRYAAARQESLILRGREFSARGESLAREQRIALQPIDPAFEACARSRRSRRGEWVRAVARGVASLVAAISGNRPNGAPEALARITWPSAQKVGSCRVALKAIAAASAGAVMMVGYNHAERADKRGYGGEWSDAPARRSCAMAAIPFASPRVRI
jgi:hypothetical protein